MENTLDSMMQSVPADQKFCQSCGMPLPQTGELYGTNADGSENDEYCIYCYENGAFLQDCTMDEMIAICVAHMTEMNPGLTAEEAEKMNRQFMPTLKRWKTN